MKRIALVFLLSILLPAALLAGLALRSLRDQELVVESQRTRLLQSGCDALADRINVFLNDLRVFHSQLVEELVAEEGRDLDLGFDALVRARWSQAAAGAVVRDGTTILSPRPEPGTRAATFLEDHADFLANRRVVEIYQAPRLGGQVEAEGLMRDEAAGTSASAAFEQQASQQKWKVAVPESRNAMPAPASAASAITRNVMPSQQRAIATEEGLAADSTLSSPSSVNNSAFVPEPVFNKEVTSEGSEGAVSRILDGELHVLLWKRHPGDPGLTFWTELDLPAVRNDLAAIFAQPQEVDASRESSFALLDSDGGLVVQTVTDFVADWSTPFVASEIGPLLPRWEVAAYLLDPTSLDATAKTLRLTLWLVILTLLGAVVVGTVLILRSVGDEMRLASRKTDFVGNVSHELKTPLTSIRMFSELLSGPGAAEPEKTRQYAEIIARESGRLARLINRLLDFSKLDRGEMRLSRDPLDLADLVQETVGDFRGQLETAGMTVELEIPEGAGPRIVGDRDALAQIVLNLLGNALKYAASGGSVGIVVAASGERAMVSVSDRGPGIPRAHHRRIFEKFYRIDESITSGIDGSGIGLALCRQIAERHGGSIRYEPRKGGGSTFTLDLPLDS